MLPIALVPMHRAGADRPVRPRGRRSSGLTWSMVIPPWWSCPGRAGRTAVPGNDVAQRAARDEAGDLVQDERLRPGAPSFGTTADVRGQDQPRGVPQLVPGG